MDWKKEYRVSDVFRRGRERPDGPGAPGPDRLAGESRPEEPGLVSEPPGWALFADVPVPTPPDPTSWAIFADVPGATPSRVPAPEPEPEPAVAHGTGEPVAEPSVSAAQPSVWKKEIRVSSLFSRSKQRDVVPGPGAGDGAAGGVPELRSVADPAPQVDAAAGMSELEIPGVSFPEPPGAAAEPEPGDRLESRSEGSAPDAVSSPDDLETEAPVSVEVEHEILEPASAAASAWKKEYRVSDLFRRGKVPGDQEPPAAPAAVSQPEVEAATESPGSMWKKEIRLGGKRRGVARAGQPDRRAPQRRRDRSAEPRSKRGDARGARPGSRLPDVPLARAINLLPREDEKTRSARLSLPGVAVGLVGVLVVGGLAFFTVYERARLTERQGDLEDLQAQAAAIETPEDVGEPDSGAELTGEALGRVSALTGALGERVAWDRLLREISLTLPDDVWLESLSTTQAGGTTDPATGLTQPGAGVPTLSITGYAVTQAGVAQLMARLAVIPQLSGVQLQSSTVVELGGENVLQFTVVATLAPSPGVVS